MNQLKLKIPADLKLLLSCESVVQTENSQLNRLMNPPS